MAEKHNPDKAMAGMLKRKAVWPPARPERSEGLHGGEACPDAATLAAYFERSLTTAETSIWEAHFSSCARCQEQLAALVRSEPASSAKSTEQRTPAVSWLWNWRFLAPVGAAVVAFAFFISYQTMRAPAAKQGDSELMARRDVTSPAPAIAEPQKSVDSVSSKKLEKGRSAADEFRRNAPAEAEGAARAVLSHKYKSTTKLPATASGAVASSAMAKPAAEESKIVAAAGRAAPTQTPPAGVGGIAQGETAKAQQQIAEADRAQAAPAAPQPVAPGAQNLQKQDRAAVAAEMKERPVPASGERGRTTPTESQLKDQKAAGKQETATPKRAPADAPFALMGTPGQRAKLLMAPGEFIVSSPNAKALWRFGASGLIERSGDKGKTWQRQNSAVSETFRSGSSPSEEICWVGGKNGVLLRTLDGGENWEAIPSPTQSDIVTVKALDESHVTVVDADGRTYETPNAGRLWRTP